MYGNFRSSTKGEQWNTHMCWGLNSHYFHVVGMVINPIVGVYMPIPRIPYYRWDDHPEYREFRPWHIW